MIRTWSIARQHGRRGRPTSRCHSGDTRTPLLYSARRHIRRASECPVIGMCGCRSRDAPASNQDATKQIRCALVRQFVRHPGAWRRPRRMPLGWSAHRALTGSRQTGRPHSPRGDRPAISALTAPTAAPSDPTPAPAGCEFGCEQVAIGASDASNRPSRVRLPRSHAGAAVCSRFRFQPVRVRIPSAPPILICGNSRLRMSATALWA
jgi:hypothetical protein